MLKNKNIIAFELVTLHSDSIFKLIYLSYVYLLKGNINYYYYLFFYYYSLVLFILFFYLFINREYYFTMVYYWVDRNEIRYMADTPHYLYQEN